MIQDAASATAQPDAETIKEVTSLLEAVEKSSEKAADTTGEATSAAAEVAQKAADVANDAANIGISSQMVFLLGLGLLALFIYYFATETVKRKRIVGSFLAVARDRALRLAGIRNADEAGNRASRWCIDENPNCPE